MPGTKEEILERIATEAKFTALPETFARLLHMFDDPTVTAAEVAALLGRDAGMVARLLRIANSAFYGGTGNVATVQQAIVKIGFRTVKAVVLSSTMYQSIHRNAPKEFDLRPFWQHGLEVAVAAMLIAEEICPKCSDEAFVAGLLHDVGRVAYAHVFPDQFRAALSEGAAAWTMAKEEAAFGVNHAETGAFLAARWNFPDVLRDAIARHHEVPDALSADPKSRVILCVALADCGAQSSWAGPAALRKECIDLRTTCMRLSGLTEERLGNIVKQVQPQMREWAELLEIDLGKPLELLERANQRLFELYRLAADLNAENEKLQTRLLAEEAEKAKLEALRVICATFSHHINNATTTILGRAQLVHLAVTRGEQDERAAKVAQSMKVIENAVDTISGILSELKCLTRFDTVSYHGKAQILDLHRSPAPEPGPPERKPV
jgi:putative nucleotidyltransferase with HDIG domain